MKSIAGPVSKRGIRVYPTPLVTKDPGVVDIPVNPPAFVFSPNMRKAKVKKKEKRQTILYCEGYHLTEEMEDDY